jgi:hypothetical protein
MRVIFLRFIAITCLTLSLSANAMVSLDEFSISENNLSFHVTGTISSMASGFEHQLLFGLVDDGATDWITSFDSSSSSWIDGIANTVSTDTVYDLSGSYSDSLLTTGLTDWQVGDQVDITFNFAGVFDLSNFDINNFGMQAGYRGGSIVDSTYNLVGNVTAVPVPAAVWLFGSGLGLLGWFRRKA